MTESIECCHMCEQPKDTKLHGLLGEGAEVALGWPACVNPECIAFGERSASAKYRSATDFEDASQ